MASGRGFWSWFEREMARQGFRSVRQVERAGRVGNDTISGRLRDLREPTDTVIRAIATAFGMSFEEVQRIASADEGVLPEAPEAPRSRTTDLTLRELWTIVREMPVEDQRAVLDYALFRRSRSDEQAEARRSRGPAANRQSPAASDGGG